MIQLRLVVTWMLLLTTPALIRAQGYEFVIHEKPLRVRHISGVIVDQKGLFIAYPAVELRDPNDNHVLATSFADGNGRFHFEDRKPGEIVEIRFLMKGFNPVQYTLEMARIGHESMKAVMPLSKQEQGLKDLTDRHD